MNDDVKVRTAEVSIAISPELLDKFKDHVEQLRK